jgi:hypothetical protein
MRGILEEAALKHGGEVIRDVRSGPRLLKDNDLQPDIVVLGLRTDEDAPLVAALLSRWPLTQVIALSSDASKAVSYRLEPCTETLQQPSSQQILASFKDAMARCSSPAAEPR